MCRLIRNSLFFLLAFAISATMVFAQTGGLTVAWDANDPSEQVTEYRLYYKTGDFGPPYDGANLDQGESPIIIPVANLADQNNPEFTLSGFTPGIMYRMALTAVNAYGESRLSTERTHTVNAAADLIRVEIQGPQQIPESTTAQFTLRAYFSDDTDSVVEASTWETDSQDAQINASGLLTAAQVNADSFGSITATYTSGGISRSDSVNITIQDTDAPTLDHIEINGPVTVDENSSATYSCVAYYSDGSAEHVSADNWSENCPQAQISANGVMSVDDINEDTLCQISAGYLSLSETISITLRDTTTPVTLDYVVIEGPDSVNENTSTDYTCRAYYSDGTNQLVTPDSWEMTTGASSGDISSQGTLTTYEVDSNNTVGIAVTYTEGSLTRSDETQITVMDTNTPPPSPSEIIMDNDSPGTSKIGEWRTINVASFGNPAEYCRYNRAGTYSFENELYGNYQVSFRWSDGNRRNRNRRVRVEIFDGDILLDTVFVNQRLNANRWNALGTYTFNGPVLVKVIAPKLETDLNVDGMMFKLQ